MVADDRECGPAVSEAPGVAGSRGGERDEQQGVDEVVVGDRIALAITVS
ncbi:hypothetical protein [Kitasatospora sp. NPDC056531]